MNAQAVYLTKDGLAELQQEFDQLKNVKRPALIQRVSDARSQGDLSENSDYTTAKEELDMVDARLEELEDILNKAEIIKDSKTAHKNIQLGSKITVKVKGKEATYSIVGEWEADPMEKKLSNDSPLGKSLMGKKEGDTVEVDAPAGKLEYKVVKIH